MTYTVDQNRIKQLYRIQSIRMIKTTIFWTFPIILFDLFFSLTGELTGIWIIGIGLFSLLTFGTVLRLVMSPKLAWSDLKIEIDFEKGELKRTGTNILPLTITIEEIDRIIEHPEGLKLFKSGWHSWSSKFLNSYNLNERQWNFYIPMVIEEYSEIKAEFERRNWL